MSAMTKPAVEMRYIRRTFFMIALGAFIFLTVLKTQRDVAQERARAEFVQARDEARVAAAKTRVAQEQAVVANKNAADRNRESEISYSVPNRGDYHELFASSNDKRRYLSLLLKDEDENAFNPTVIPHPTRAEMWIVVAQREHHDGKVSTSQIVTCEASLFEGALLCEYPFAVMPLEPSIYGECPGALQDLNYHSGPRETRFFYGPDVPYLLYGSQSRYTCIGAYLEDARPLLLPFFVEQTTRSSLYKEATEIHRPNSYNGMEGKSFLFWDSEGNMYSHYDFFPKRAFSQVNFDGAVTENLAASTEFHDQKCMAQYMPKVGRNESIEQATNVLSITLCERNDPGCIPSDKNTYLMHIFHRRSYFDEHAEYEPYVVLFDSAPPFAIHSIAQRPYWIHGRNPLTMFTGAKQYTGREEEIPEGHSEAFYVTGMSWKTHGQTYHGYIDDPLFLSFGIEETVGGFMDIKAGDLLQDLGFCDTKS